MDVLREALRVFFIVGIVAIPLLYWISGRATGRNENRARNENERARRSAASTGVPELNTRK